MTSTIPALPPPPASTALSVLDLVREGVALVRSNPVTLLVPLVVLDTITGLGEGRPVASGSGAVLPRDFFALLPFYALIGVLAVALLIVTIFLTAWVWLAATNAALSAARGGSRMPLEDSFRGIRPLVWSGTGTFFLAALAIIAGIILLIVPGFIVMSGLLPIASVVVAEGLTGSAALRRTWGVTKGHKGKLFVLILAFVVALIVVGLVFRWLPLIGPALAGAAQGVLGAVLACSLVAFYRRVTVA